ncbi:MAG: DUF4358 domain-containing protein [Clostridia bacterium]|nr:DUF4358 domain-containing protein [Clostridia bacterium]
MKKITLIAALLLCFTLAFTACASSYRSDVAVNDLTSAVLNAVSTTGGFTAADSDYVDLEFAKPDVISANVDQWMICASTSSSTVDEFGIFRVKDGGDVSAVKAEVSDYVQALQVKLEVYLDMYDPAEKTKLENAQVTVYGNYVVFTMLSEADTAALKSVIEDTLAK